MKKYQGIHNIIRKDYIELLSVTEKHKDEKAMFNSLYHACIRSLFSLIEADIYGLNNIDNYENYSDKDSFEIKLKKTFKKVCETWNKPEIQKNYFSAKYFALKELRKKRDELIHPKKVKHLHKAGETKFEQLKEVFYDYDKFINDLMNNFYISININPNDIKE